MACRCRRCNLGRSGLARESRRFIRPHCVVESRLPATGAVGLVAGGVTLLITIVGGGNAWHPVSTWANSGPESDAVELVDGLCSCRKFGSSTTVSESRRFFVAPTTFGGGGVIARPITESRRLLRLLSPDPRREPFLVQSVDVPKKIKFINWIFSNAFSWMYVSKPMNGIVLEYKLNQYCCGYH